MGDQNTRGQEALEDQRPRQSSMPSKEQFLQLLNQASCDIEQLISRGRRDPSRQAAIKEQFAQLVERIREAIGDIPEEDERTFLEQQIFCEKMKKMVNDSRDWLKVMGENGLAETLKTQRKEIRTKVKIAMAIN